MSFCEWLESLIWLSPVTQISHKGHSFILAFISLTIPLLPLSKIKWRLREGEISLDSKSCLAVEFSLPWFQICGTVMSLLDGFL